MGVLDHAGGGPEVGIVVADLDGMSQFYEQVLGLNRVAERRYPSGTTMVVVERGGTRIKLNRPEPPPRQGALLGRHRDATGIRYLTFVVDDAIAARNALAGAGVDVDGEVMTSPAGALFFARDPEGNNLEFVQPGG